VPSTFAIPSVRRDRVLHPAVTAKPKKRCVGKGTEERCKIAIQTNNVEVDERDYIYAVDRANTGMHILRLAGAAREAMK